MKNKNNLDNLKTMDLQLFAELSDEEIQQRVLEMFEAEENTTPEGAEEEIPVEDTPVEGQQLEEKTLPIEEEVVPTEDEPALVEEPQPDDMLLGKFKSIDDLAHAYSELESYMTQTRQELAQTKELANQLQAMTQAQQNELFPQDNPAAPEQPQDEPEEDFMEKFYSDPKEALRQVIEETITPEIAPIKNRMEMADKQEQWAQSINEFGKTHPDLAEYQGAMADIIIQNPELRDHPSGLSFAYDIAKGRNVTEQSAPETLLQDEEFVNQNILSNQEIKDKIIKEYLAQVQEGSPPASIGTTPASGQIPMTPPKEQPRTLDEANELALEFFKK